MTIRVAGAQLGVSLDIEENIAAITRAIAFASSESADILLTPEGSLSGYTPQFDAPAVEDALNRVTSIAREKRVGLALGTCFVEAEDGRCYNQIRFYQPDGTYLGFHSKTLTCGAMNDAPEGEINDYTVAPLRTFRFNEVTVGGLICNDMWANPGCTPQPDSHLSHELSRKGADIVFHAVNGGRDGSTWAETVVWPFHESNLRLRARVSRLWIVTVDNCHPSHMPCSAPSGVINPDGDWACRTQPKGEQYFAHTVKV